MTRGRDESGSVFPGPGWVVGAVIALAAAGGLVPGAPRDARADGSDRQGRDRARAEEHRSLIAGLSCGDCHTPNGWEMAPGEGRGGGFDHARTGFPLVGRHAVTTCAACHAPGRRVRQGCASCHRSPHQARLGQECQRCHSPRTWESARAIVLHQRTRLPLTGAHLLADCTQCHLRTGERQLSSPPPDCVACHEADVRSAAVHPDHLGRGATEPFPRDCSLCHRATAWSPAFANVDVAPIHTPLTASGGGAGPGRAPGDHELRFPIRRGPHRGLDCASCHARPAVPQDVRCTGCHAHAPGRLAAQHARPVPRAARACLSCHPGGSVR